MGSYINDNKNLEIKEEKVLINSRLSNNLIESNKDQFSNPINIQFYKYLIIDSYVEYLYDNSFSLFYSINLIYYLIYPTSYKSIIILNLINNKRIIEIKNAHNNYITNLRHYLDQINNRDFLLSISNSDCNIKIWDAKNWECLLNLENIYKKGYLSSASFLKNNNENFIITCNSDYTELIKLFNFNGNKMKEINDSNDNSFFIDTFYDKTLNKTFIITGNNGCIKSYDYHQNIIYHKYIDKDIWSCFSFIIKIDKDMIKIINASDSGYICIWNFHKGNILTKIKIGIEIYGICLWNDLYLFVGTWEKKVQLIDLNRGKVIKKLNKHNNNGVRTIKKIVIPKFGEYLLSHDGRRIILWKNID